MKLTITEVKRVQVNTKYGEKTSVRIKAKEYGDKILSGFADKLNSSWQVGDLVEAKVTPKGEYLNFTAENATYDTVEVPASKPSMSEFRDYNKEKNDGMRELNAKKGAYEYANLMMEMGFIKPEQWQETFSNKANEIYNTPVLPF